MSAALNNARTNPSPTVMMGRTSFLIGFLPLVPKIMKRIGIATRCGTCAAFYKYITTVLVSRRAAPPRTRGIFDWRGICEMPPKALTLWDVPILMNSILYMYLHVLLKYNARVAVRAEQLTRRSVAIHHLTSLGIALVPSSNLIGASLMLQSTADLFATRVRQAVSP